MIPSHYSINRSDAVAILWDQDEKYMSGKSGITVSHHITQKSVSTFFSARHLHHEISLSPASNIRWTCWTHGPRGTNSWANRRANRRHPRSENCMLELLDCSTAIDTMHVSLYKRFGTYNNPRVLATYIYESNSCDNAILSLSLSQNLVGLPNSDCSIIVFGCFWIYFIKKNTPFQQVFAFLM